MLVEPHRHVRRAQVVRRGRRQPLEEMAEIVSQVPDRASGERQRRMRRELVAFNGFLPEMERVALVRLGLSAPAQREPGSLRLEDQEGPAAEQAEPPEARQAQAGVEEKRPFRRARAVRTRAPATEAGPSLLVRFGSPPCPLDPLKPGYFGREVSRRASGVKKEWMTRIAAPTQIAESARLNVGQ